MTFGGHIENGVVVFDQPVALPEAAEVRVEPCGRSSVALVPGYHK